MFVPAEYRLTMESCSSSSHLDLESGPVSKNSSLPNGVISTYTHKAVRSPLEGVF